MLTSMNGMFILGKIQILVLKTLSNWVFKVSFAPIWLLEHSSQKKKSCYLKLLKKDKFDPWTYICTELVIDLSS